MHGPSPLIDAKGARVHPEPFYEPRALIKLPGIMVSPIAIPTLTRAVGGTSETRRSIKICECGDGRISPL